MAKKTKLSHAQKMAKASAAGMANATAGRSRTFANKQDKLSSGNADDEISDGVAEYIEKSKDAETYCYTIDEIPAGMAKDALGAQQACNLTGLCQSLARHTKTLNGMGKGTDWVNQHPVIILFVAQLCHLSLACVPDDPQSRASEAWLLVHQAAQRDEKIND